MHRTALTLVGLAALATRGAHAQRPTQPTDFSVLVGAAVPRNDRLGGVDMGGGPNTGVAIVASLGLHPFHAPLSFRLDAQYARLGLDDDPRIEIGGEAPVVAAGTARVFSGTGNVVLTAPVSHRFRPYLTGGVGIYHLSSEIDIRTPDGKPIINSAPSVGETRFGVNGGAGIELTVGTLHTIVEARYHSIFTDGPKSSLIPLTLGLRF